MTENRENPSGSHHAGGRYSFGDFTLDTISVTFLRGQQEISLPPRVLDLLEYLIERPGQVISKEELLEQVWEGRFVGEESLTQAVSVLRQALGDDTQQQLYIRTVPKRGYAFAADVVLEPSPVQATEAPSQRPARQTAGRWKWALAAAIIALVAAGAAWLVGRAGSAEEKRRVMRLSVNLARSDAGDIGLTQSGLPGVPFAISPDGTRLVIQGDDRRGNRFFLRDIDGFEMTALADTEGVGSMPLFSPDGQWILFRREGRLEKVSVRGGSSIELGPVPGKWHADWGPDGTILMTGRGSGGLFSLISGAGGEVREISGIDRSDGAQLYPQALLPDGESILAVAHTVEPWSFSFEIVSRSTGERRRLLDTAGFGAHFLPNGYIVYGTSDTLFAVPVDERTYEPLAQPAPVLVGVYAQGDVAPWYTVSETGTLVYLSADLVPPRSLVWVDRTGAVSPVPGGRLDFSTVRISPDGRQAALTLFDGLERGIWVLDLSGGSLRPVTTTGWNSLPNWSPDGRTLTYYALRGDGPGLSRRRADGSGEEERLLAREKRPFPRHWSPDGRRLVFWEGSKTWQYMDGVVTELELEPTGARSFRFSPDGQLVAFEGQENDTYQVYVQRFPEPGPRVQVSGVADGSPEEPGEGRSPNWRADGKELYYSSRGAVFAVEVQTAPELRVGPPRRLFEGDYWLDFDATPDGERFLMRSPGRRSLPRELQVVLNWFEEIEHLVPHPQH